MDKPSKKKLQAAFSDYSNNTETLDLDGFKRLCYKFYLSPTTKGVDELFKELDKNSDAKLTFDEVEILVDKQWTPIHDRKMGFLTDLKKCRKNTGPITRDELKVILTQNSDDALTDEDIDYCFDKMDLNGDKQITEEEIAELMFQMDEMSRANSRCESRKSRRDRKKSKSRSRSRSGSGKRKKSKSKSRSRSRSGSGKRRGSKSSSSSRSRSGSGKRRKSKSRSRSRSSSNERKRKDGEEEKTTCEEKVVEEPPEPAGDPDGNTEIIETETEEQRPEAEQTKTEGEEPPSGEQKQEEEGEQKTEGESGDAEKKQEEVVPQVSYGGE